MHPRRAKQALPGPGFRGGVKDGRDDRQWATAVWAVFQVDIEDPLEQPSPADVRRPALWNDRFALR